MNAERLALVIEAIQNDVTSTDLIGALANIVSILGTLANEPQEQHQNTLKKHLDTFHAAVTKSKIDDLPKTWSSIIDELKIKSLLGEAVRQDVEEILSRNNITVAIARDDIQGIVTELNNYMEAFENVLGGFEFLEIKEKAPALGEAEISFLIPRSVIRNELKGFSDDVIFLHNSMLLFAEISTGGRDEPQIIQAASTNPLIIVGTTCICAQLVLGTVLKVTDVIGSTYHLRELKAQAEKVEAGAEIMQSISARIKAQIEAGTIDVEEWLLGQNKGDEGRKHELGVETHRLVIGLADRLDKGYKIDGDAGINEEEGADEELPVEMKDKIEAAKKVKELADEIRHKEIPEYPVLNLPAPDDEGADDEGADDENGGDGAS